MGNRSCVWHIACWILRAPQTSAAVGSPTLLPARAATSHWESLLQKTDKVERKDTETRVTDEMTQLHWDMHGWWALYAQAVIPAGFMCSGSHVCGKYARVHLCMYLHTVTSMYAWEHVHLPQFANRKWKCNGRVGKPSWKNLPDTDNRKGSRAEEGNKENLMRNKEGAQHQYKWLHHERTGKTEDRLSDHFSELKNAKRLHSRRHPHTPACEVSDCWGKEPILKASSDKWEERGKRSYSSYQRGQRFGPTGWASDRELSYCTWSPPRHPPQMTLRAGTEPSQQSTNIMHLCKASQVLWKVQCVTLMNIYYWNSLMGENVWALGKASHSNGRTDYEMVTPIYWIHTNQNKIIHKMKRNPNPMKKIIPQKQYILKINKYLPVSIL